jgi:hypothetical protein
VLQCLRSVHQTSCKHRCVVEISFIFDIGWEPLSGKERVHFWFSRIVLHDDWRDCRRCSAVLVETGTVMACLKKAEVMGVENKGLCPSSPLKPIIHGDIVIRWPSLKGSLSKIVQKSGVGFEG